MDIEEDIFPTENVPTEDAQVVDDIDPAILFSEERFKRVIEQQRKNSHREEQIQQMIEQAIIEKETPPEHGHEEHEHHKHFVSDYILGVHDHPDHDDHEGGHGGSHGGHGLGVLALLTIGLAAAHGGGHGGGGGHAGGDHGSGAHPDGHKGEGGHGHSAKHGHSKEHHTEHGHSEGPHEHTAHTSHKKHVEHAHSDKSHAHTSAHEHVSSHHEDHAVHSDHAGATAGHGAAHKTHTQHEAYSSHSEEHGAQHSHEVHHAVQHGQGHDNAHSESGHGHGILEVHVIHAPHTEEHAVQHEGSHELAHHAAEHGLIHATGHVIAGAAHGLTHSEHPVHLHSEEHGEKHPEELLEHENEEHLEEATVEITPEEANTLLEGEEETSVTKQLEKGIIIKEGIPILIGPRRSSEEELLETSEDNEIIVDDTQLPDITKSTELSELGEVIHGKPQQIQSTMQTNQIQSPFVSILSLISLGLISQKKLIPVKSKKQVTVVHVMSGINGEYFIIGIKGKSLVFSYSFNIYDKDIKSFLLSPLNSYIIKKHKKIINTIPENNLVVLRNKWNMIFIFRQKSLNNKSVFEEITNNRAA